MSSRKAFTLIELLVVIAIIAILAVVVVLTLNPAQLLAQSRDANRVSDLDTLTHALSLYQTDQSGSAGYSLGNASVVYISLPDPTISGTQTSTCAYFNLPTSTTFTYQCSSPQNYRNSNGLGWLPISFQNISSGNPLGALPTDPTNSSSTGLYYSYATNGTQYEVNSLFESQKYKTQYAQSPIDPGYPEVNAKGSSLAANPLFNPTGLVGYWPMDEGNGSSTIDASGNGNVGSWSGTPAGTNSTYYSTGKVGNNAGVFDGSSTYVTAGMALSSVNVTGPMTLTAWIYPTVVVSNQDIVDKSGNGTGNLQYLLRIAGNSIRFVLTNGSSYFQAGGAGGIIANQWTFLSATFDGTTMQCYVNAATSTAGGLPLAFTGTQSTYAGPVMMGNSSTTADWFHGFIDDVRIYNRALSAAEIQAIYNAEK